MASGTRGDVFYRLAPGAHWVNLSKANVSWTVEGRSIALLRTVTSRNRYPLFPSTMTPLGILIYLKASSRLRWLGAVVPLTSIAGGSIRITSHIVDESKLRQAAHENMPVNKPNPLGRKLVRTFQIIAWISLSFTISLAIPPAASAQVPGSISYQGYLTDIDGSPISEPTSVHLELYNVEQGGAPLWTETLVVPMNEGLFSATLGSSGNPLPAGISDGPIFLGVSVAGETLTPRRKINSSAYALKSVDAERLNGLSASQLDQSTHVSDMNNPHGISPAQIGAADSNDVSGLSAAIGTVGQGLANVEQLVATNSSDIDGLTSIIAGLQATIAALESGLATALANNASLQTQLSAVQDNSVLALDGLLTLDNPTTATFSGVNVQVVNGTGSTDGTPNSLGNLIVGYNEVDQPDTDDGPRCSLGQYVDETICATSGGIWAQSHQSGSHNLIVGAEHNYSQFGGIVAGADNNITGAYSTVSGGTKNTAAGVFSSAAGGRGNTAIGAEAVSVGGRFNESSGEGSATIGGGNTVASQGNHTSALLSVIVGGTNNRIRSDGIATATGQYAVIVGGAVNLATGNYALTAGGALNETVNQEAVIVGGNRNLATSIASSILGGEENRASARYGTVVGGVFNRAGGLFSTVSGGIGNLADGLYSSVSGGSQRTAPGTSDWVAGELFQDN